MTSSGPSVARTVADLRRPPPAPVEDARQYVNLWREAEALGGDRVRAMVLILRTRGCYWADLKGCTMCGYARDTLGRSATPEEIREQLARALRQHQGEPYVKIYTSGSFFDPREVPREVREEVAIAFRGRARRLLVETLPEFVQPDEVRDFRTAFGGELEVALGLESTQDEVLRRAVNKGSSVEDYLAAAARLKEAGALRKAYLLLKPPYLTEKEALQDALTSVLRAAPHFDTLSVNPVHIQGGTVVEHLFRQGVYRPPWIWSLLEVLREGHAAIPREVRLVSFPTSGGNLRGIHNCLRCDADLLARIQEASLRQDFRELDVEPSCPCRETWRWEMEMESLAPEA